MKGRLPLGPFDAALRQPLALEFELDGPRVSAARIETGLGARGLELMFEGLTPLEGLEVAGRICARSTISHSLAYCQALEEALGIQVDDAAEVFRAVAAEYERVASHLEVISDVGRALRDDVLYKGPRRFIAEIREAFGKASGSPFGFGMVVPGGAAMSGDGRPLRELASTLKTLARDCSYWGARLKLSRGRLRGAALAGVSQAEEAPPAPAFRAAGLSRDARSGEDAYGFYRGSYYRPVTREGGTALDRSLLLLDEARASASLIRKISDAEGVNPGVFQDVEYGKGKGIGICESPDGAIEHAVFLGAEGRIIRNRVSRAVCAVADATPRALTGARYEDIVPEVVTLCLCAACIDL